MSLKELGARFLAKFFVWRIRKWSKNPSQTQRTVFKKLIKRGKHTRFGEDHNFNNIKTHKDFTKHVKVKDYEELKPYVDRVVKGEKDVLWPGRPLYFAKTSCESC